MSTPLSNLVRQLGSAGCSIEQIAVAVEHHEQQTIAIARQKAEKNATRQARYRSRKITSHNATLRNEPLPDVLVSDTAAHIEDILSKDSIKKVSKKVYLCADIPEKPPEEAIKFAEAEGGWLLERTLREWQRFRDYQISKNKKHNSLVALLASWRNWVRSPFQATGKSDDDRSVLKAADRQMDRFGGREAAANYVPGSAGPRPLGLDHGHEPSSPKLISSR